MRALFLVAGLGLCLATPALGQGKPIRFWNLTARTVSLFALAPAGTMDFGTNQCANDRDGTVDHNERLKITGVAPGLYDARIGYPDGRTCLARGLKLEAGEVFSVEDSQLVECASGSAGQR